MWPFTFKDLPSVKFIKGIAETQSSGGNLVQADRFFRHFSRQNFMLNGPVFQLTGRALTAHEDRFDQYDDADPIEVSF